MSKKSEKIETEAMSRLVEYAKAACLICSLVHVKSFYLRLRDRDIILCHHCYQELSEVVK